MEDNLAGPTQFVVTAEMLNREPDGLSHHDGSELVKVVFSKETWVVPAKATIGDVMEKVRQAVPYRGYTVSITLSDDNYKQ